MHSTNHNTWPQASPPLFFILLPWLQIQINCLEIGRVQQELSPFTSSSIAFTTVVAAAFQAIISFSVLPILSNITLFSSVNAEIMNNNGLIRLMKIQCKTQKFRADFHQFQHVLEHDTSEEDSVELIIILSFYVILFFIHLHHFSLSSPVPAPSLPVNFKLIFKMFPAWSVPSPWLPVITAWDQLTRLISTDHKIFTPWLTCLVMSFR